MTKKRSTSQSKNPVESITFIGDSEEDVVDLTTLDENDTSLSHEMRDNIKIAKEEAKHPKSIDGKFDHDACYEALLFIQDQLERAFLNFVVLGETAKQVVSPGQHLSLDFIHLGMLQSNLSLYGLSTIRTSLKKYFLDITVPHISLEYNDVPIVIVIVQPESKDAEYLQRPDKKFFHAIDLDIPNPFDKYIEMFDNKD